MISSSQIKENLALYLSHRINLAQFENWFVPNSRDIRLSHSEAAKAMVFAVEAALSEYLSRVLKEQEFRNELSQILSADTATFNISIRVPHQYVESMQLRSSTPMRWIEYKNPAATKTVPVSVGGTTVTVAVPVGA